MSEQLAYGLSRRELEREMRWLLRKAPQNAADLPAFIGELIVTLIDKNNAAWAQALAEQKADDLDLEY